VVVERAEEQVLLVSLVLNGQPVVESLPVYPLPAGVLVPLGEFCRALQLAVEVDPLQGRATGWFIEPSRRFQFDALTGTAMVAGRKLVVPAGSFEVQAQDIFVEAALLRAWFPVDLTVDLRGSILQVTPREKLPIQAVWERNAAARKDLGVYATSLETARAAYVPLENPYRIAEVPALDQTLRIGQASTGTHRTSVQSTTLTSGDLLGLEHQGYLGLSNHAQQRRELRLALGRRDPEGRLLGPLQATQFQFGDVLGQGSDLVLGGSYGRGFTISNAPLQVDHRFDRRTFRGNLPPGWHVELYHNTALLGLQAVKPDGTYAFEDVPIYFGPNEYKLVFYGPQGERREQVVRSDVNPMQVPQGTFRYRLYGQDPDHAGRRALAEGEYGLGPGLSLGVAAMSLELQEPGGTRERHTYTALNVRGHFNRLGSQLTVARMDNGRTATQALLQTGLGFSALTLRHARYQEGYRSETLNQAGLAGPLMSSTDLTLFLHGGSLLGLNALSTALGVRRDVYAQSGAHDAFFHRLSTTWRGLNLSNDLSWTRTPEGTPGAPTRGQLGVSRSLRGFGLRGAVGYTLSGRREVTDYTVSADHHLPGQGYLQLHVVRQNQGGLTTTTLAYQRALQAFSLGADLSHTRGLGWEAHVTLRTTVLREPRRGRWSATTASAQSSGSISALAYVDRNNNGIRDDGEPVKPGVGFTVNGFQRPQRTDAHGVAHLPDVGAGTYGYIRVDNASLEDPLWRSTHPGFRLVSRGGHAAQVELPVVALGEVDGTVTAEVEGRKLAVAGLLVELVDASGQAVRQIRSAFDGYFLFQDVPPGTYTLRIHREDAARRRAEPLGSRSLTFQPTGTLLDGQDLQVRLLPAPRPIQEVPDHPRPTS